MGVDILLYAEINSISKEDLDRAERLFNYRTNIGGYEDEPSLEFLEYFWFSIPRVEVTTLSRYYSKHYDRGYWPEIYKAIRAMQYLFSKDCVYYGGDSSDGGDLVTEEFLGECWMHWFELEEREV